MLRITLVRVVFVLCFAAMLPEFACDKAKSTSPTEAAASPNTPVAPHPNTATPEGNYRAILQSDGLSFQATEAHEARNVSNAGTDIDAVYAFWFKNHRANELDLKKLIVFTFGSNKTPLAGYRLVPPDGEHHIVLKPGDSHVLAFRVTKEAELPDHVSIVVERADGDAIFTFCDLHQMMQQKYDARVAWIKGSRFEGVDRIVHPRFYDMGGITDIGHGSEVFIGEGRKMEEVFYDLGPGKDWFENRSMNPSKTTTNYVVHPLHNAELQSEFERFTNRIQTRR